MALMIGCIWHGLDALQGTRAKPGNHLVLNKSTNCGGGGTTMCFLFHAPISLPW